MYQYKNRNSFCPFKSHDMPWNAALLKVDFVRTKKCLLEVFQPYVRHLISFCIRCPNNFLKYKMAKKVAAFLKPTDELLTLYIKLLLIIFVSYIHQGFFVLILSLHYNSQMHFWEERKRLFCKSFINAKPYFSSLIFDAIINLIPSCFTINIGILSE